MFFWGELRRRNVFKVAAAYAIVAWLIAQVTTVVAPALSLPGWFTPSVILFLVLGFPLALVLAWAYEVTPEGIRKTQHVPLEDSIRKVTGQKLNYVVIGLLALAVILLVVDKYVWRDSGADAPRPTVALSAEAAAESSPSIGQQDSDDVLERSIAVLPFDNLSPKPEHAHFAPGVHLEIIGQLAKIKSLRVIPRTTVLRYGDASLAVSEIAKELKVRAVMEGSVRYAGDRIRVSVELIDALADRHLWAETYEREFADIFAIQSDIAMNVVNALQAEFSLEEQEAIVRAPTNSTEAYALFLQARNVVSTDRAAGHGFYDRALAIDPQFALAHAAKASLYASSIVNQSGGDAPSQVELDLYIELARQHAARANELDPALGVSAVIGSVNFFSWRWAEARLAYENAAGYADDVGAVAYSSWLYSCLGEHAKAVAVAREFFDSWSDWSPRYIFLAVTLAYSGERAEAHRVLREAIVIDPTYAVFHHWLAVLNIALGNEQEALNRLRLTEQLANENTEIVYFPELAYAYSRSGHRDDALRIFDKVDLITSDRDIGEGGRAMLYLAIGDEKRAVQALETAIEKINKHEADAGFFSLINIKMNFTADPLLEQPTFLALRDRILGD